MSHWSTTDPSSHPADRASLLGAPASVHGDRGRRVILATAMVGVLIIAGLAFAVYHRGGSVDAGAPAGPPTVVRNAPVPITNGGLEMGGDGPPIPWSTMSPDSYSTSRVIPGGVAISLNQPHMEHWSVAPVTDWFPSTEITGVVQFTSGRTDNSIGLGCIDSTGNTVLSFRIADDGSWGIVDFPVDTPDSYYLLDHGTSRAIHETSGPNALAIACEVNPLHLGTTRVQLAINGVPVANDVLGLSAMGFNPTVDQCSCSGVDTASFTQVTQYGYSP